MHSLPEHLAHAVTNRGLKLIVNSTEQCNLRCTYCYESFALKQMPFEVATGIIQLVDRRARAGLDWLEVEFFGGEPLAAWHIVKTLSARLHDICRERGVALSGSLTTNGTLLNPSRLAMLAGYGFNAYQITLDGPQELHDLRRRTPNGKGTFSSIWQKLEMMSQSPYELDVIIRLHFDASTVATLTDSGFFSALARILINDRRFALHFKPLEAWPGVRGGGVTPFKTTKHESQALRHLLESAKAAGIPHDQLPQTKPTSQPTGESGHVVCYAARSNSFVIRSDGRISKCTVALDDDRNIIGRIMSNGALKIDHDRHLPWLRGLISGEEGSLCCPAAGIIWST